ncbi:MAG TPA: hypothetical protein DEA97_18090 [Bacteroidales bacterium]|nr:hypothetical protein [Bacteroidales bacterium]
MEGMVELGQLQIVQMVVQDQFMVVVVVVPLDLEQLDQVPQVMCVLHIVQMSLYQPYLPIQQSHCQAAP